MKYIYIYIYINFVANNKNVRFTAKQHISNVNLSDYKTIYGLHIQGIYNLTMHVFMNIRTRAVIKIFYFYN